MEWKDPPERARTGYRSGAWLEEATALKLNPGRWALIASYVESLNARNLATNISKARIKAFRPQGSFEGVSRTEDGKFNVYARYKEEEWGH